MNRTELIVHQTFAHTVVDQQEATDYLLSDPGYLASSMECEEEPFVQLTARYADNFEFWLRRYIAGCNPSLRRVYIEIRAFMAFDEAQARAVIPVLMERSVLETLLEKQWYEWIPRYERARERIQSTFGM